MMSEEFESDEDKALDKFAATIGEMLDVSDSRAMMMNPVGYAKYKLFAEQLKQFALSNHLDYSAKEFSPSKQMAVVKIAGDYIKFGNLDFLKAVMSFADIVDVAPLTNGKIEVSFDFYGVAEPIE